MRWVDRPKLVRLGDFVRPVRLQQEAARSGSGARIPAERSIWLRRKGGVHHGV